MDLFDPRVLSEVEQPPPLLLAQCADARSQALAYIGLSHLHEGDYKVLFAVGEDWDRARFRFTRYQGFFEFGKSLDFTETEVPNGVEYSHHSITLYTTPLGNVKREVISEAEFDAH